MDKPKDNSLRHRWVNIRLTEGEHQQIMKGLSKSTDNKLSSYARKLILGKPVKVIYRNATLDDFMEEMIRLRKELSAVGNNFNQLVKRVNSVKQTQEVFLFAKYSREMQVRLLEIAETVKSNVDKFTQQWFQNS